ncbi:MAG: DUF3109 family protein [Cyclobacteriaceae bacterium]|nr:DUF3109 family protein [Cyclobacteriaceae bacterium]
MIELEKTILSDDIKDEFFVCDVIKCKGACCVEGDLGAPLEDDELTILDEVLEQVVPYLTAEAKKIIKKHGAYILDEDDEYSTPTIYGKECVYAIYDDKGILKCAIEQAYNDGKITFQKPISCHLYPIRTKQYEQFTAINYDRWNICSPACHKGQELQIPLYKFLKTPLIRKFGQDWYDKLENHLNPATIPTRQDL